MKTIFQIFFVSILLVACNQNNNINSPNTPITKVSVAFSGAGCEGICVYQALSIDNNLNIQLYNGRNSINYGYYQGQISKEFWDDVQTKFKKLATFGMDTTKYEKTDHPDVEVIISLGKEKRYFKSNTGKIAMEDLKILYLFFEKSKLLPDLKRTDSLNFETTIQY